MLMSTIAELASLGAVLPFLGALTAPDRIFSHPWTQPIVTRLGLTQPHELLLPLTLFFMLAAIFAGATRLAMLWGQTRFGNAIGVDLGSEAFRRTLYQPYTTHLNRNSSEVVAGQVTKVNTVVYFVIIPFLVLVTSTFIVIVVVSLMIWVEPLLTLATCLGLGCLYVIVIYATRKLVLIDSQRVTTGQSHLTQVVQEGLGGIRDILIDGIQEIYFRIFKKVDSKLRRALGNIAILSGAPRPLVEATGVVFIGGIAYAVASRPEGISGAIPILGMLALAAQRLLPLVQQAYSSWTSMLGGRASLNDVLDLLEQPLPTHSGSLPVAPMSFLQSITVQNLHFRYGSRGQWALRGINLQIPRGSRIGFIGATGSGKSTLLDLLMGLLAPTSGTLCIDHTVLNVSNYRAWQARLAHVPQSIFLADATIAENIAFGVPRQEIDRARLHSAAERAKIGDTIESWSKGYDTFVGERGVRLSGGQRQRIGIARALYKDANVLILDEATSALDNDTENAIMKSINGLGEDLTVLLVAHRLTTLAGCERIVELVDGRIARVGTYKTIVEDPQRRVAFE
jgi:ATP-binding cassette subfamily B protein